MIITQKIETLQLDVPEIEVRKILKQVKCDVENEADFLDNYELLKNFPKGTSKEVVDICILLNEQETRFEMVRFDVLFEHFVNVDIMSTVSSSEELEEELKTAQQIKLITKEYLDALAGTKSLKRAARREIRNIAIQKLICEWQKIIKEFQEKHGMPIKILEI